MADKRSKTTWINSMVKEELLNEKNTRKGFEAFKLGVMFHELRKEQDLTQEQLADKCGTTKTYISRIENDASDIRLSPLMRIVREGLGGHLKLRVEMR